MPGETLRTRRRIGSRWSMRMALYKGALRETRGGSKIGRNGSIAWGIHVESGLSGERLGVQLQPLVPAARSAAGRRRDNCRRRRDTHTTPLHRPRRGAKRLSIVVTERGCQLQPWVRRPPRFVRMPGEAREW